MITIDNLTVQFGGVRPLDGLSAELRAPVVGLIGPNGAGKTTLLNVLSGFVTPVQGSVRMDDVELLSLSPRQRVRAGLRRVFQQEMVVEDLTAFDNVMAIADHVSTVVTAAGEVEAAIDFVGLRAVRDVLGRRLSLYERRMTEIAKTLVGKPKVVLLDEPAAGLNDTETARLRKVVAAMPDRFGVQVVLIDHDADLIASVCHETLVLDFGKRLAIGPTAKVLEDPVVRRAYLGTA
ncbi:MAG: ATP-binding cassette domain-containing protein [Pseudomonadota bacterium]